MHTYDVTVTWTGNDGPGTADYRSYRRDNVVTAEWTKDPMRPGDTVILTLSKGADLVTVPNVVGKNMAQAIELIEAAGLVASWELPDLFLPVATVQSQDPAGDTQAIRNSTGRIVGSLTL